LNGFESDDCRYVQDAAATPLVTWRNEIFSGMDYWSAFRGWNRRRPKNAIQKALFGLVSVEVSTSVRRNKGTGSTRRTMELEQSRAKAG
jgi:hypothetical protein